MTLQELRTKHPRFIYKSFDVVVQEHSLYLSFEFHVEPDINFRPSVTIPLQGPFDMARIYELAFHLGMVEAISYWKSVCAPLFVVEAGMLSDEELSFWQIVFREGLGEFYFQNSIDFRSPDFLVFQNTGQNRRLNHHSNRVIRKYKGNIILVGGGKDSALTLELFKKESHTVALTVNATQAAREVIRASEVGNTIEVQRTLDPQLFKLNATGYLNGHTPFSALLSFVGVLVAELYGKQYVVVSNEKSANEGNIEYLGMTINHQYSKSHAYEKALRQYVSRLYYTLDHPTYYSFLRPLTDLQISGLFSNYPQYFGVYRSCNVGSKQNTWCGNCPKCAFTYLTMSAFLPHRTLLLMFGSDFFTHPKIIEHIKGLVGATPVKPFECVGSIEESQRAIILSVRALQKEGIAIPAAILTVYEWVMKSPVAHDDHISWLRHAWDGEHFLPSAQETRLKQEVENISYGGN